MPEAKGRTAPSTWSVDSKLGYKDGVDSCQPPPPSGRSQANGLRLFVCGPDGDFSQLDGVNPSITARELAKEFIESRYGYFRGGRLIVVYERDGQRVPLAPR